MGRVDELVKEGVKYSKLYRELGEDGRAVFVQSVQTLVERTVSTHGLSTVRRVGVRAALKQSGAEELLGKMKTDLLGVFKTRAAAFSPALRNITRDVLLAMADPQKTTTVEDIRRRRGARVNFPK